MVQLANRSVNELVNGSINGSTNRPVNAVDLDLHWYCQQFMNQNLIK